MSERPYDICGWATKFNVRCADGRTIRSQAFDECDHKKVPLVWQHMYDKPSNVLGHAMLYKKPEGMWTECWFNDSDKAEDAKLLIRNHDIDSFSIYANGLKHKGKDVIHGNIREVSLVLAGANPEALIEYSSLAHDGIEGSEDDEATIYSHGLIATPELVHSGMMNPSPQMVAEEKTEKSYENEREANEMPDQKKTVRDIFNELTPEQKTVVEFIIGTIVNEYEEGENMKHNAFANDNSQNTMAPSLSRDDYAKIFSAAKKGGSLRSAVEEFVGDYNDSLAHSVYNTDGSEQTYGIADIDLLFPEYKNLTSTPEFIKRDMDWAGVVMGGVRKTPFARVKSQFANITGNEARAKGYIKGRKKAEEVFTLLKRTTDPQTVYKKQKMDRDDIVDITDFDVVAWIKSEMRMMLDEEIARAILVGDGRLNSDDDKIMPDHIRPIWGDDELYTIKAPVTAGVDDTATARSIIRAALKARKDYKGSGNLAAFMSEDWLTEMLLLEDGIGHPLYPDATALARKLRVQKIVTSPVMENLTNNGEKLAMILVDMKDYTVGADKGGEVNMFEDFDIDYNQQKYLIETRICGALTKPYSAIAVTVTAGGTTYTEVSEYTGSPAAQGWYEKEGNTYVLSTDTEIVSGKTYYTRG